MDNDLIEPPIFSEVVHYTGIAQIDWSWAPLAVDAENDGYWNLMITNGLPIATNDLF